MPDPRRSLLPCIVALAVLSACTSAPVPARFSSPAVTVYAAGDIADCRYRTPENSDAAATAWVVEAGLVANPGAMVLSLGDHTYPVGLPAEFTNCYHPTWGRFKERTLPVPGNHEYYTPGAPGYYAYFGARAAQEQDGYYSVQLGKWHVIALNSTLRGPASERQLAWLQKDLAHHPVRCTLALMHHPRYSSGGHGANPAMAGLWQVLVAGGVELVLSGHDHDYERFAPQDGAGQRTEGRGMRQFVVGTGGAMLTPLRLAAANSEVKNNSVHGVLRLDLYDSGYTWEFLAADNTASPPFTDRGVDDCH